MNEQTNKPPGLLSDTEIVADYNLVIRPFEMDVSGKSFISFGLSSYGYDIRTSRNYKVFTDVYGTVIDPKRFDSNAFVDFNDVPYCLIPPNSFALAESLEYVEIPRDIIGICCCKSTYARCGIVIPTTVLEPCWKGKITLEICNTTPLPVKVYSEEGICQVLFFRSPVECQVSYEDKDGKYQNQQGLTLPFVR